jgi:hypothetical protein
VLGGYLVWLVRIIGFIFIKKNQIGLDLIFGTVQTHPWVLPLGTTSNNG